MIGDGRATDPAAPGLVVIRRSRATLPDRGDAFVQRVARLFPHLNWRAHIYLLPGEPAGTADSARVFAEAAAAHLARNSFAAMVLHPFVRLRAREASARDSANWTAALLAPAKPFREEAYYLQGEPRLMISPVLDAGCDTTSERWLEAARVLRAASAHPSVISSALPTESYPDGADRAPRFYLAPSASTESRIDALAAGHVVESALARLEDPRADLLAPCRPHLVIDEASDMVFACFKRWRGDRALCALSDWQRRARHADGIPDDLEGCVSCLGRSLSSSDDSLRANRREAEAYRLHFELAVAMARRESYHDGAAHARRAASFAATDSERGSALLHQGLCHLSLGELELAEAVLAEATGVADDPGLVAYHRGRNQLEWRDYIEALDRFEEARASGSSAVPTKDLCFQMALCHVRLEEYGDARPHIERWRMAGGEPASVLFYEALCDLGDGDVETALASFRDALAAEPEASDLSRVLFYIGHCLKELDRPGEAIEPLRRATEIDPDDLALFNLLGFCYYKTARHQEAVDCFRRAIAIDPTSGIDHANLASNLRDLGRTDEAMAMYEKALVLDPTIAFARDNLARLRGEGR